MKKLIEAEYEYLHSYMRSIRKDLLVFLNGLEKRKPWCDSFARHYWELKATEDMLEPLLGYDEACD